MMKKLLICTNNQGKLIEISDLLKNTDFDLVTPKEVDLNLDVAETGPTYEANATLKAVVFGEKTGLISVADDTGLEVEALNGNPGVQSKRFFKTSGEERNQELLKLIDSNPNRKAKFVAAISIYNPKTKRTKTFSGAVSGEIINPKGTAQQDLGYDSIFFITQIGKTFAQASLEEKNKISHRAIAVKKAIEYLNSIL